MQTETHSLKELTILNGLVNLAIFLIYPFLILEWKNSFGVGINFSILVVFSICARIFGALFFPKLEKIFDGKIVTIALVLAAAGAGAYGYSHILSYIIQIVAVLSIGFAHGIWIANLQNSINLNSDTATSATKISSNVQLVASIGVVIGSLVSNIAYKSLGFGESALIVAVIFLLLACATGIRSRLLFSARKRPMPQSQDKSDIDASLSIVNNFNSTSVIALVGTILTLIAYSSLNFLAPISAKEFQSDFPVGNFFAINALIVIVAQYAFSQISRLHLWSRAILISQLTLGISFVILSYFHSHPLVLYIFVVSLSFAEVALFPAFSGMFKFLISQKAVKPKSASSLYITAKIFGLGTGGILWPKLTLLGNIPAATTGIILVIFSIASSLFVIRQGFKT